MYRILQVLLQLWKHECKRVIADRFTMPEDVDWFDHALAKLIEEQLGEEERSVIDFGVDGYFVDFLRDAPEATGTAPSQITPTFLVFGVTSLEFRYLTCHAV